MKYRRMRVGKGYLEFRAYRAPSYRLASEVPLYDAKFSKAPMLFVVGSHRSGTSLLARELGKVTGFAGIEKNIVPENEGQHHQSVLKNAAYYGGPGRFCSEILDIERDLKLSSSETIQLVSQLSACYEIGADRYIEKSPVNLCRIALLRRVFPNAKFLHITRHPIATSLATKKWANEPVLKIIQDWFLGNGYAKSFEGNGYYHRVRYEDLSDNTKMAELCSWLGLERPMKLTSFASTNEKYFSIWRKEYAGHENIKRALHSVDFERFEYDRNV